MRDNCLVWLDVAQVETAVFVRRVLRHPQFNTEALRMGAVVHVTHSGLWIWRLHAQKEMPVDWSL